MLSAFCHFHKSEALTLPCSCPLKVSQCVEPSRVEARGKWKENSVNACRLCACHSSCEVIRVCLVLPPRGLQAEWETWPLSSLFADYILQCFLLYFYFYCRNMHFLVRQNLSSEMEIAFILSSLQFIPVFWGIFILVFDCSLCSHDAALCLNVGVKWDMNDPIGSISEC